MTHSRALVKVSTILHSLYVIRYSLMLATTELIFFCKFSVPCKEQSFQTRPIFIEVPDDNCIPGKPCMVLRPSLDGKTVTHHTVTYKVHLNDLVSSVGGGLGLFLGFSILATLTGILGYCFKRNTLSSVFFS